MPILIIASLMFLTFIFFPEMNNRMFYQESIGLGLIACLLAYRLKKVHWSVSLMFLVSISSAILMTNYPAIYKYPVPQNVLFSLESHSLVAYFILLSFGMLPFLLEAESFSKIGAILFLSAIADSIFMIIKTALYGINDCFAMLSNSAIDASFIACLIPTAFHMYHKNEHKKLSSVSLVIMISAIVLSKSSTGTAAIAVGISAYYFMIYGRKAIAPIIAGAGLFSCAAYWWLDRELLNPNGRYHIWNLALGFYSKMDHLLIGSGVGTFFIWGPEVEKSERVHQLLATGLNITQSWQEVNAEILSKKFDMFTWLHNEWLQVLFEMGIIGLSCLIILYYFMVVNSWKKKNALFSTVIVYGFISITQMTLRYFVLQLLGACLIMCVFTKQEDDKKLSPNY